MFFTLLLDEGERWELECFARNSDYELSIFLLSSLSFTCTRRQCRGTTKKKEAHRLNIYFSDRDKGIRLAKWSHLFLATSVSLHWHIYARENATHSQCWDTIWLVLCWNYEAQHTKTKATSLRRNNESSMKLNISIRSVNQATFKWRTDFAHVTHTIKSFFFFFLLYFVAFDQHSRTLQCTAQFHELALAVFIHTFYLKIKMQLR